MSGAAARRGGMESALMARTALNFRPAEADDFDYIYGLCESTMRAYVEADLGDCFEKVARPTIQRLIQAGLFSLIHDEGVPVGAIAHELHDTHIQLEEIYLEPARQNLGLGAQIMKRLLDQSQALGLPVRLHVLSSNPARRFYERLGFSLTRSTPAVNYLEYQPRGIGEAR